ncbi:MAG: biotin/lipoyl-binding protein [Bacteroidales bacterium]|nr:biotin/lipoyl-binding protein [Bacteroidales bacterium]
MKTYKFKINGKDYTVDVNGIQGKIADVSVNGVAYSVELENEAPAAAAPAPQTVSPVASATAAPAAPASTPASAGAETVVHSPLPGVIISIDVKEGQTVKKGQKLAVLEAMKMENEILSDIDCTVTSILVHKGDSVLEGAGIMKIA